mmetsp:Transcript_4564/g.8342  ORF Transcript_4564/g.8342 Transcript_4564/m.8342 type:complete len:93 (+) Transcript_4564:22-300(+)
MVSVPGSPCLLPLSRFSPYRLGADDRKDVIAERSLGLCKYLDHVLKRTEPPAPKPLVQIVDGFVTKKLALRNGLRHGQPSHVSGARGCPKPA